MNRSGTCRCEKCGYVIKLNEKTLYYDNQNDETISVENKKGKWRARLESHNNGWDSVRIKEYRLQEGLPASVVVEYSKSGQRESSAIGYLFSKDRICPSCYSRVIHHLFSTAGYFDTYYIGVIGSPGVGKTVYQKSIIENLREKLSPEIEIVAHHLEDQVRNKAPLAPDATKLGEDTERTLLIKQKGIIKAQLRMVDTAGEINTATGLSEAGSQRVLSKLMNSMDAYLIMYDPRSIESDDMHEYIMGREAVKGNADYLMDEISPGKMPICYVMTGADTIQNIALNKKGIHSRNGIEVTSDSNLFMNKEPTGGNVVEHIHLTRDLFRSLSRIKAGSMSDSACFLVSSGRDIVSGQKKYIDYKRTSNISFPIIWIANRLGLLSFMEDDYNA